MKRFASTIVTLIVIANVLPMQAFACNGGGGGYRPSIRPYYGPSASAYRPTPTYHAPQPIYGQPVQQRYIQQPTVRTISTQSRLSAPQIRIAPSQRAQVGTSQFGQAQPSQQVQAQPSQPNAQAAPQSQPATPTQTQPSLPQQNNNVNSALAMLAGQQATQPESTPAPQATTETAPAKHVGNWTASVGNNATVRLTLQADGSFDWVATNGGKESRFEGRFTIQDGTLTLARGSDNQKLSGSMTFNGNGFNFKLNGAKDSGLNFTQQG